MRISLMILTLLFTSGVMKAQTQEILTGAGEVNTYPGIEVEWTVGDLIVETGTTGQSITTQGFLQPNLFITAVTEKQQVALNVFPNPASDHVSLHNNGSETLSITIIDMSGKIVCNLQVTPSEKETIDLSSLSAGMYILHANSFSNNSSQFKIQKVK